MFAKKLKAYKCPAGTWTIGYGHTNKVHEGLEITKFQAENLLDLDLTIFERAVSHLINGLTQNQFDALVSFTFNLGIGAFESSTLLKYINLHKFDWASKEFLRWNKSKGKELEGLTKRRKSESLLFSTGELKLF